MTYVLVGRVDVEDVPMASRRGRVIDHGDIQHSRLAAGNGRLQRGKQIIGRADPHAFCPVGTRDLGIAWTIGRSIRRAGEGRAIGQTVMGLLQASDGAKGPLRSDL